MIISIEGARNSGKTFLIEEFFKQNTDPRFVYYKFYFVNWVKRLGLDIDDTDSSLHYLSVGNILSVMEKMHNDNSKAIIFDRSLLSCYAWSQLRRRITKTKAINELKAIMTTPEYSNFHSIYINPIRASVKDERNKDIWDNLHKQEEEHAVFHELIMETYIEQDSLDKNTAVIEFKNFFDEASIHNFNGFIQDYAEYLD